MKFTFIHAEKALFPLAAVCRIVSVTRAGHYVLPTESQADVRLATRHCDAEAASTQATTTVTNSLHSGSV